MCTCMGESRIPHWGNVYGSTSQPHPLALSFIQGLGNCEMHVITCIATETAYYSQL